MLGASANAGGVIQNEQRDRRLHQTGLTFTFNSIKPLLEEGGPVGDKADRRSELVDPDPDDVFVFLLELHCGEGGLLRVEVFAVFELARCSASQASIL